MKTDVKNFPKGYTEDQLLYLIWEQLSGVGVSGRGLLNPGRRGFPYGLDRKDVLYLIWSELSSGVRSFAVRYEVSDIASIDGSVLDALRCGDQVAKVTGKQRHLYTVTYKGEGVGEGICLTYADASVVETVSYDLTADGWVYNSTDKSTD